MKNSTWQSLVNLAIIGTERGHLPEETTSDLQEIGIDTRAEPSTRLLLSASIFSIVKKAATPLIKSNFVPSDNLTLQTNDVICSAKSIQHLRLILSGLYPNALGEFLNHLQVNDLSLPSNLIPEIIEKTKKQPEIWNSLRSVLGQKGSWIIKQNPKWQYLLQDTSLDMWDTASSEQRFFLFKQLRQKKPLTALKLLKKTWKSERIYDKIKFTQYLSIGLSKLDEAFLEDCLDSKNKDVRREVAIVLAKIPDSALSNRMFERIKKLWLTKNDKPSISLPDYFDESMSRDGIDPKAQWFKGGIKASRLGQMWFFVPLSKWEHYFKKSKEDLLSMFLKSDLGSLLLQASIESSTLHSETEWMELLLENFLTQKQASWSNLRIDTLIDNINSDSFNKIAVKYISSKKELLYEQDPIFKALNERNQVWSDDLTMALVYNLQKWLEKENAHYWKGWHYKKTLNTSAYLSNPKLYNQVKTGWNKYTKTWGNWENEIEQFLDILQFRTLMINELSA